ncbi:hypothetical protein [Pedobacter sp. UYP1]|uniref:hypothetical protein n=1 Tax=Pedobacter sp. UYP1 TaxID=1756396 RepID=UPI003390BA4C
MNKSVDEEAENKWNNRYQEEHYAYGKGPNLFFKEWLYKIEPGSMLMPADGEGRNGVFAAQLGWKSHFVGSEYSRKIKGFKTC